MALVLKVKHTLCMKVVLYYSVFHYCFAWINSSYLTNVVFRTFKMTNCLDLVEYSTVHIDLLIFICKHERTSLVQCCL